ncbi:unnamed protein product [Cercospora beticola]|nr:unnamed protein product [Cercospora beticola]
MFSLVHPPWGSGTSCVETHIKQAASPQWTTRLNTSAQVSWTLAPKTALHVRYERAPDLSFALRIQYNYPLTLVIYAPPNLTLSGPTSVPLTKKELLGGLAEPIMLSKDSRMLLDSITGLFCDSTYSDATIQCGERKWRIHKAVVCSQCDFFKVAFDGRFKEGSNNTITLKEDHPNAVAAMLRFLYSTDYDDTAHNDNAESDWHALAMNVHVHAIGDKYGLPALSKLALFKFDVLLAQQGCDAPGFLQAIIAVYFEDKDRKEALRRSLMACVMSSGKPLLTRENFQTVAKGVPAFAVALVSEAFQLGLTKELQLSKSHSTYRCPACGVAFTVEVCLSEEQKSVRYICCPSCATHRHRISTWEYNYKLGREAGGR